jgi:putative membrane protein
MSTEISTENSDLKTQLAQKLSSNQLAVDRTRLAHERTLLAWVRTATSLISFGFTIYKFFQYLQEKGQAREGRILGPREFALVLIGTGLIALLLATVQHRLEIKRMRALYPEVPYSLATLLAGLMSILGIIAFVAIVLRQ